MRITNFALSSLGLLASSAVSFAAPTAQVTFYKDVLPVLQKNCQSCHRPGEAAPMSFLSYDSTRPWAKAIKTAVASKKMPPWHADPAHGKFLNDRRLNEQEVSTLVAWADTGAKPGNAKEAPKPLQFVEGWEIGKPDVVIEMPTAFEIPASGTIDYQYVAIPTNFKEDKWVQIAEARPEDREHVHHIIAFIREPGSAYMKDLPEGVPMTAQQIYEEAKKKGVNPRGDGGSGFSDMLVGFAPGTPPVSFKPGQAKLVKAGSHLILQMHYTANGKPGKDKSRIGITFSKTPVTERVVSLASGNQKFEIPPQDANYRVDSTFTLQEKATLIGLLPHMHLRGRDFQYTAIYPTGEKEILLSVPKYDFNWQNWYELATPKVLPAGTRIDCIAHFDNSSNNPANPDPNKKVTFGEQSWDEMMFGFFDVAIDAGMKPMDLMRPKRTEKKPSSDD
jgi:mono/diheme cytochrome c family protein